MNWIQQVLDATEQAESPRVFIYWAALAAIAGVMRKNVYLDRYYYKLYPNIYVLLIAKSGMRKAFPVTLAKRLVRATKVTRVISGRNSVQGIIQDLATAYTLPGGGMITDGHGFLAANEFSSFTVRDQDALTILTDLYDTHDHEPEWRNKLKSGIETVANPCLTMLGASNQTHLKDKVTEIDTDGGFVGRTLMILGEKKNTLNPLVEPPEVKINWDELAAYLKEISQIEGAFTWSPEAGERFSKWYLDFFANEHEDTTGTANRIHDQILKVAMLTSLSHSKDLILELDDINAAITSCMEFMASAKRTMERGKTPLAEWTHEFIRLLLGNDDFKIDRATAISKLWHVGCYAHDLDQILDTLTQANYIYTKMAGKSVYYQLTPNLIEKYKAYEEK